MEKKTYKELGYREEEIMYKGYSVSVKEDCTYMYIDFHTGAGEAVYPKREWLLDDAIEDQYLLDKE